MQDRAQVHRAARFVLRGLLLAAAAFVLVLLGASTAQADDADPARQGPPEHRLSTVASEATSVVDTAHRSVQRAADTATTTVREAGREIAPAKPVTEPVAEVVATVVDRTAQGATDRVAQVTRSAEKLVDGPVTDVVDETIAPVTPPADTAPESRVENASAGQQETGPAAGPGDHDRRTHHTTQVPPATSTAATDEVSPALAPRAVPGDATNHGQDLPPLDDVLGLGAFSGAPSAGSGGAGGPASAGMLPWALVAPADLSRAVVAHADDERLFALPITPGWSPD